MILNTKHFEFQLRKNPFGFSVKYHRDATWYRHDYKEFCKKSGGGEFPIKDSLPCLYDKDDNAGNTYSHYFLQDLYVAQKIYEHRPEKHVDVGSRVDGFVAHVATFREIELLDIRKMESTIPHVFFSQLDLMNEQDVPENYCDSISSLHALEHFGLGRYGDPIDPEGHLKGFRSISKMLKTNGIFYFSVPIGVQRIEFNAHRIFGMPYLLKLVSANYDIESFAYIEDKGVLHRQVELTEVAINTSFGCNCGCAIFELRKRG